MTAGIVPATRVCYSAESGIRNLTYLRAPPVRNELLRGARFTQSVWCGLYRLAGEVSKKKVEFAMQMVKIQIPNSEDCAQGFSALIRRGRVDCYPDNIFIIPEPGLQLLQQLGIAFTERGRAAWFGALEAPQ